MKNSPLLLALFFSFGCALAADRHDHDGDDLDTRRIAAERIEWRDDVEPEHKHAGKYETVRVKILGLNDFHGQLSAERKVADRPAGGAAVLAAYLKAAQQDMESRTIIAHAGDHVGASPAASALLQDEPSITFLTLLANKHCSFKRRDRARCNLIGTPGNHEFDEGRDEMLRLIRGGNHPAGPFLEDPYRGANFPYVSANVIDNATGHPLLPPYVIKRVRGVPIAFIARCSRARQAS